MLLRFVFLMLVSVFFVHPSMAQDVSSDDVVVADGTPSEKPSEAMVAKAEALRNKITSYMKNFTQQEAQHFFMIYTNYTIISMVNTVRKDVGGAVEQCIENNPDMETELDSRFTKWDEGLAATLEESETNLQGMISAQNYMPATEFEMLFSLVDETRTIENTEFKKIPVTTPEACQFVLSKMDETGDGMNHLLRLTLVSYPQILQQMQR